MAPELTEGLTRRTILKTTGAGAAGVMGLAAGTGTVSANCPCEHSATLGKINEDDLPACGETTTVTLTLDGDDRVASDPECQSDKDIDVQVTATDCKRNGEVTCVDLKIVDDNGACKCADDGLYLNGARVKGGPTHAEYDCGDVESNNQDYSRITDACAPVNGNNGKRYGISHIDVIVCVFPKDKETGDDCAEGGGG